MYTPVFTRYLCVDNVKVITVAMYNMRYLQSLFWWASRSPCALAAKATVCARGRRSRMRPTLERGYSSDASGENHTLESGGIARSVRGSVLMRGYQASDSFH